MTRPDGVGGHDPAEETAADVLAAAEGMLREAPDEAERRLLELLGVDPPLAVLARAHHVLARRRVEQGRPGDALVELDVAARAYADAGDDTAALRTTLGRMHALDELGRHGQAVAEAEAALGRLDVLVTDPPADEHVWLRAALQENRGVALGYAGRTAEAIEAARAAHAAWSSVGAPEDLARAAGNLGVELLDAGRATEALDALQQSVAGFRDAGLHAQEGMAQAHTARALALLGEPTRALVALDHAIELLGDAASRAERDRARVQRAVLLLDLGWWHGLEEEASSLEEAARRDARSPDEGRALLVRAAAALSTEDHRTAVDAARRAVAIFDEIGQARARASAQLLAAQSLLATDDHADGRVRELCVGVADAAGRHGWLLQGLRAQLLLARVELADGRHGHAAALAVEVRRTATRLGLLELEAGAEHLLAGAHEAAGDLDPAIESLEHAVGLLERARARLTSVALHTVFLGAAVPAHDDLVRLLLDRGAQGDHRRASEVAGLRRERTVLELRRGRAERAVDPERREERAAVLAAHGSLRARLDAGTGATGADRALVTELETLARRLRSSDLTDTALAAPPRGTTPPVDRARPGVAVVDYLLLGDEVLAFVGAAGALIVVRDLATRAELRAWSRRIAGHWRRAAQPGLLAEHADVLQRDADRDLRVVARAVLDPVLARLPAVERLAVVPRGPLLSVPFAALPLDDGPDPERLLDRAVVQTAVVARADDDPFAGARPDRGNGVLVVGGGVASPPAVRAEVEAVARAAGTGAVLLTGHEATSAALAAQSADAAMVHLAGHGLHDPLHPALSGIRLADRWVSAAELGELPLGGTDIVLSACETARRSAEAGGGESTGLVTAILAAGARTVVSTLWPVDDAATAVLMPRLHELLARGIPPDRALASAQQQARAAQPHPYAWAGFTCQVLAATDLAAAGRNAA